MSQHVFTIRTNLIIFAILMALLALTVAVSTLDLGALEIPIALTIAFVKAILIMLYFMHLRFSSRLTWLFAGSGTFWLLILIAFSMSDFLSRGWLSPIVTTGTTRDYAQDYFGSLPDPDSNLSLSTHETTGESGGDSYPDRGARPDH
ncbi:cytochrome C oxidase subunit IV family protein [Tautonia plasticadhaerens]|uniref:Caa(3)-type oxidase subunit IV n=1 Tax=Tautonia plasticadhaerens TaxID=2527974 RepID=A0A518H8E7_9BACT|nr:cytochrome C oxidase subunit IV family protein [Tautonia plasticadhaerens]QDV37095.1 hypothetical protein ElP_50280 [Tautonia plasticadhaerens]